MTVKRPMIQRAGWRWLVWLLLGLLVGPAPAQGHAAPATQAAPLTLSVTPSLAGSYVPGTWLALDVRLENAGAARSVHVAAALPNSPARYARTLDVPAGATRQMTLYVWLHQASDHLRITVEPADSTGAALLSQELALTPHTTDRLLGLVGVAAADLALPDPAATRPALVPLEVAPAALPTRSEALGSLGLLLLADASLSEDQQQAIAGWVWQGGHLVLSGGAGLHERLAFLPPALRPVSSDPADGTAQPLDTRALGARFGSPLNAPLAGLAVQPAARASVVGNPAAPLIVQQPAGRGLVTVLAFAATDPTLNAWDAAPAFWNSLLGQQTLAGDVRSLGPASQQTAIRFLGRIADLLPPPNLPPLRPFGWLLLAYVLAIGPGVLLVLRRRDRLAWAWVAMPGLALLFLALGGGLALLLAPDPRFVTQATLVQQTTPGQAHVRSMLGIAAPVTTTMQLQVPPDVLLHPLPTENGRYLPIAGVTGTLMQQREHLTVGVGTGAVYGLLAEQTIALPTLEASILLSDTTIMARVHNTLAQPLRRVTVLYGEQMVSLGDLPPGAERSVRWPYQPGPDGSGPAGSPPATASKQAILRNLSTGMALATVSAATNREGQMQRFLLEGAIWEGLGSVDAGPWVLAWLDEPPAPLTVQPPGAATRQRTLLSARPSIEVVGGEHVALPAGWLRLSPTTASHVTCLAGDALGISTQPAPVDVPLRLPAALTSVQALSLTLELTGRDWPNAGVRTALYNWQQAQWDELDFAGPGTVTIDAAAPYLHQGRLRVRLSGRINEADCVFVQAALTGRLDGRE